jgi:hypothetical protein
MKLLRFTLFLLMSHSVIASDAITIAKEISNKAEQFFYTQNFNAINEMDDQYRNSQSRLPDGRWNLTFIYSNIGSVSSRGAESEWKNKLKLVNNWINKTPNHAAPYLAKADILIGYAWDARGSDWANTVTDHQWILFNTRIQEARKVLEDSSSITATHPYWFLEMEIIAKAQSWPVDKFQKLYNSASDMYPTYYFIHFRAADYYQPRWHGSKQKLREFINAAVDKSKDKEGMTLYTRIYWSQLWALKENTFANGYAEWPIMKQGFEDIMRDYPTSTWNLNAYAYYSCMAKDWETTKKLINKIGNEPHLSIWESKEKYYTCKSHEDTERRYRTPVKYSTNQHITGSGL